MERPASGTNLSGTLPNLQPFKKKYFSQRVRRPRHDVTAPSQASVKVPETKTEQEENEVHTANRRMTDRIINIQDEDVLHQGWLKKQGGAFRSWQRRYFKVTGEFMYYYAKEEDTRALGYIPLRGNLLKKHTHNAEDPGKHLFEILPGKASQGRLAGNHDSFLLWAGSQLDLENWIQVLRRVMYGRRGGGIFGQSLLDTITNESITTTQQIPSVVEQCVRFLRKHGLQEEGIFRLPGRTNKVKELQDWYDIGEKPDLEEMKADVHTVASLLKLYLRSLPEPVIPWQHYEHFYDAIKLYEENKEEGKQELIRELAILPRVNYNLMKYLCHFLNDVQLHEKHNRMGVLNLSTVFGPNMFRANNDDPDSMMEANSMSQKFIHLLISEVDAMFPSNDRIPGFSSNGMKAADPPIPPPRHKAMSQMPSLGNFDLIQELKDSQNGRSMRAQTIASDSLLIDLNPDEELDMEHYGNAAFTKRSYSVDDGLGYRDSISVSDTASIASIASSNASETSSQHVPYADFNDTASVTSETSKADVESLVMINPACQLRMAPCDSTTNSRVETSPRKESRGLGMDLMQGTPENDISNMGDMTLSYSHLQDQVRALKTELCKQKEEYELKIRKYMIKLEGTQVKYENAESLRKATDDRNKQLLSQINAFIAEYGHQ